MFHPMGQLRPKTGDCLGKKSLDILFSHCVNIEWYEEADVSENGSAMTLKVESLGNSGLGLMNQPLCGNEAV